MPTVSTVSTVSSARTKPAKVPANKGGKKAASNDQQTQPKPKIKFPTCTYEMYRASDGTALTAEKAQDILGWTVLPKDDKTSRVDLMDYEGNRIHLKYNGLNRRTYMDRILLYEQDMLNKRWRFNGEAMLVSLYGNLLSIRHRLCALVRAQQRLDGVKIKGRDQSNHWEDLWPDGKVTIDCTIGYGFPEDEDTVRTIDNILARTFGDVLFTMREEWFPKRDDDARQALANLADRSIATIWQRTGQSEDNYLSIRSHSEGVEWVRNHPRFQEVLQQIHTDYNTDTKRAGKLCSRHVAVAFAYLMCGSASDPNDYKDSDPPYHEKALNLKYSVKTEHGSDTCSVWERALTFWAQFFTRTDITKSTKNIKVFPLTNLWAAIRELSGDGKGGGHFTDERMELLGLAWEQYVQGNLPTPPDLVLEYDRSTEERDVDDNLVNRGTLITLVPISAGPSLGIDLGRKKKGKPSEEGREEEEKTEEETEGENQEAEEEEDNSPPTPEEIAAKKEAIRQQNIQQMKQQIKAGNRAPRKEKSPTIAEPGSPDGKPPPPKLNKKGLKPGNASK